MRKSLRFVAVPLAALALLSACGDAHDAASPAANKAPTASSTPKASAGQELASFPSSFSDYLSVSFNASTGQYTQDGIREVVNPDGSRSKLSQLGKFFDMNEDLHTAFYGSYLTVVGTTLPTAPSGGSGLKQSTGGSAAHLAVAVVSPKDGSLVWSQPLQNSNVPDFTNDVVVTMDNFRGVADIFDLKTGQKVSWDSDYAGDGGSYVHYTNQNRPDTYDVHLYKFESAVADDIRTTYVDTRTGKVVATSEDELNAYNQTRPDFGDLQSSNSKVTYSVGGQQRWTLDGVVDSWGEGANKVALKNNSNNAVVVVDAKTGKQLQQITISADATSCQRMTVTSESTLLMSSCDSAQGYLIAI